MSLHLTLLFTMQIDLRLIANASRPNVIKTKIIAREMTYSVVDVMLSSRSGEESNEEDNGDDNGQWDGKTR